MMTYYDDPGPQIDAIFLHCFGDAIATPWRHPAGFLCFQVMWVAMAMNVQKSDVPLVIRCYD